MKATGGNVRKISIVFAAVVVAATAAWADWNKGLEALNAKQYAAAIKEFEAVIEASPTYAGAYYMKGVAEQQDGKLGPAVASLRKAAELDPKDPRYAIAYGGALVSSKKYPEAYTCLKALDLNSIAASMRTTYALNFASAAAEVGKGEEAVSVLKAQIAAEPKNANLQKALAAAQGDDPARAFEASKKAYDLDPKDEASGRNAVKAALMAARQSAGDQDKSRYYSEAGRIAEKLSLKAATFDHHLLAGEAWMGAKEYRKALQWLEKAQSQQSQNALVHFYRGQCHSSLKEWSAAMTELQKALDLQRSDDLRKKVYNQMGFVLDNQGDYAKAAEMYKSGGSAGKAADMVKKGEAKAQNAEADREKAEYREKIAELEIQIKALEDLGDTEEAQRLREHVAELKKHL